MTVGLFTGSSDESDAFVRNERESTHATFGWKEVIETVFGHECLYFAARDATGKLVGVLPMPPVKSRLFGHYLVSMPLLNYGGPVGQETIQ